MSPLTRVRKLRVIRAPRWMAWCSRCTAEGGWRDRLRGTGPTGARRQRCQTRVPRRPGRVDDRGQHLRAGVRGRRAHCAVRVDHEGAPAPGRRCSVERSDPHLVHDGVAAHDGQFLFAIARGGLDEVEDELGATPGEMPGVLGEPDVVADREADLADAGQLDDLEARPHRRRLVGAPGKNLAVARDALAVGGKHERGVVDAAVLGAFKHGAGYQPNAQLLRKRPEREKCRVGIEIARQVLDRRVRLGGVEVQLGVHPERHGGVGGGELAQLCGEFLVTTGGRSGVLHQCNTE